MYAEPTVTLTTGSPEAGWRALGFLLTYGLPVRRFSLTWDMTYDQPTGPHWEITFWRKLD